MVGGAILIKSPKNAVPIVLKSPKTDAFFQSVKSNNQSVSSHYKGARGYGKTAIAKKYGVDE